jgi:hypothetical protein
MTITTAKDYWISSSALYIDLNALDNPDYIQASCLSGAQILVYVKGIISYDAGHNYRRWSLQAAPTVFNTHTAKYVYVAIPRSEQSTESALVVFPSEQLDIYGKNAEGTQVGSKAHYYIFLQGIISSSGDDGTTERLWTKRIATGMLSSDEAIAAASSDSEWYKYSSVDGITTFLKDLTMKAGTKFYDFFAKTVSIVSGGKIAFEDTGDELTGVADFTTEATANDKIVTPKYVDDAALSKRHDDTTPYDLSMKNLTASGTATIGGNADIGGKATIHGATDIFGNTVISGTTTMKGNVKVGSSSTKADFSLYGDMTFGEYISGIAGGSGGKIDASGNAELASLTLRQFLEVPELRYNRVSINVGNDWRAPGGGIIESVEIDYDDNGNEKMSGTITLHLEDGEIGEVAYDDICQGIWHNYKDTSLNDTASSDDSKGNFTFAGFSTCYFRITDITNIKNNSTFKYSLRPTSDSWGKTNHPQAGMHFVCYGNFSDTHRQSSRYSTLTYERFLKNVADWEFSSSNLAAQFGDLSNLEVFGLKMTGYSAYLNNIYMTGTIQQFENLERRMEIDQSLNGVLAPTETETVTVKIKDGYGQDVTSEYSFKVERDSDSKSADDVWNAEPEHLNCGSVFKISFSDLHVTEETGGISTLFSVTATKGTEAVTNSIEY